MKGKPTTDYNPQGNSIIERVHQVVGNCLRTFELKDQKVDMTDNNPFEPFTTAVACAIRSTYHTTSKATPGQPVFGRDMILPVQFKADWATITQHKQNMINKSNQRENQRRAPCQYRIGEQVLLNKPGLIPKMVAPRTGPYQLVAINNNGTVTIQKNDVVQQTVNIRRVQPYDT